MAFAAIAVPFGNYIVDFVCHAKHLIVEADGGQHAENERDAERDRWLVETGYRVLRFWNNGVLKNPNGVLQVILAELSAEPKK